MSRINHRQRIYDVIRSRILRGDIVADERLVDTTIAAEMGVSRMPVREAMMQLVSEGYLEGTTRGFMLPRLGDERIAEIFLLRRLLEPRAAASAAMAMTEADHVTLRQTFAASEATLTSADFEAFYRASESFRDTWLRAVPNTELRAAIQRYVGQVQAVRLVTMRDSDAHCVIVAGQRDLLDTFIRRDPIAAADRILRFVLDAEASWLRIHAKR